MDLDVGESLAEDGVNANGGDDAFRLGFVGAGNLAESIARGVAAPGVLPASAVRPERAAAAPSAPPPSPPSVPPSSPPTPSDVIVISVKPQIVKQVLVELKPLSSEEKLLVSIVVGIMMKDLQRGLVQRVEEDLQHICPGGGDTMVLGAHAGILLDLPWCTSNFQLTGEGTITLGSEA